MYNNSKCMGVISGPTDWNSDFVKFGSHGISFSCFFSPLDNHVIFKSNYFHHLILIENEGIAYEIRVQWIGWKIVFGV